MRVQYAMEHKTEKVICHIYSDKLEELAEGIGDDESQALQAALDNLREKIEKAIANPFRVK